MNNKNFLPLLLLPVLLGGCAAPMVVGITGVATGAVVATDRRTAGTMLDDQRIEMKVGEIVDTEPSLGANVHVSATSYNGQLLLTGEVPDQQSADLLVEKAKLIQRVNSITNELLIGPLSEDTSRRADLGLTGRVKSRLIADLGAGLASHIKVVSERGNVYLMGMVNRLEAAQAVEVVRYMDGVERVVKVFEYQS